MQRRNVVIIVVLLLLVTLYLVIMVYGLAKSDSAITIDSVKEGFASTLEKGLGALAPGIDGKDLSCNSQNLRSSFRLTRNSPSCVIDIPSAPSVAYRRGTLSVIRPGQRPPTIYVRSVMDDNPDIKIKCQPDSFDRDSSRLEVSYLPDGESAPEVDEICWVKQKLTKDEKKKGKSVPDVAIVVMTDPKHKNRGGKLTLTRICSVCSASQAQITLKWQ